MYGNQDEIGAALEKLFSEGVVKRQDIWVTSKARHSPLLMTQCSHAHAQSRMLSTLQGCGACWMLGTSLAMAVTWPFRAVASRPLLDMVLFSACAIVKHWGCRECLCACKACLLSQKHPDLARR